MKITNKKLRTIGILICGLGIIISLFFKEFRVYIVVGSVILGFIVGMPWIKEEKSESK